MKRPLSYPMRLVFVLLLICALLSCGLTAFAAEEGSTDAPATEIPAVTTEPPASGADVEITTEHDATPLPPYPEDMKYELYPADVQTVIENNTRRIVKTYLLTVNETPADIPRDSFERDGWLYTLTDITQKKTSGTDTRTQTETVEINTNTNDLNAIIALLSPTLEYKSEDGYCGIMKLDLASVKCEAAGYKNSSYTVTATREYPHLSSNDLSLIPKTITENGRTLELDSVSWETQHSTNIDYNEIPDSYRAVVKYIAKSQDPFWDTAASMLLLALVFYLKYEAPPDEQNFPMVMEMLRAADVREEDEAYQSPLDELFDRLEMRNPEHIALKYYHNYRSGSAKTLKSIQITLAARLEKFNLESLAALSITDELDLESLGEKKTALFVIIPDNDSSFNFLVSILYTQLFQQLFYSADHKHGGSLPVHVHFLMDEFANVSLPDDFDKILSVMRSRGVSVSIILQNLAQLKALFEKQHESIIGNCDEFLYLGGNEQSTHKYVSELLGKETLDTNTYGKSSGRNGNYSTNYQISGRELLTPDEVRMLDNRFALLFVRGERPIMDEKFDIMRHPNVSATTDGKGERFVHGAALPSSASIVFYFDLDPATVPESTVTSGDYQLLSDEDLEEMFNTKKESVPHEKK